MALRVDERITVAEASVVPWAEDEELSGIAYARRHGRKPVNAGKPWSGQDDSDLRDYDEQHFPIDDAAELLCREPREVLARREALKPKAG